MSGLLQRESIDWSGKYVFKDDGSVDAHKTAENGVRFVDMNCCKIPVLIDVERDELERAKVTLIQAMRPPTNDEFAVAITKLTMHCGMQNKHPSAIKMMLDDYFEDFGDYPKILIEDACKKWRKKPSGNEWMPKSSDFIEMMFSDRYKLKKLLDRTKLLLGEAIEDQKLNAPKGMKNLGDLLSMGRFN